MYSVCSVFKCALIVCCAVSLQAHASSYAVCQTSLKQLLLPGFKAKTDSKDVVAEVVEDEGKFYKVRLFNPASKADGAKEIGWATIDANKMAVMNVTRDGQPPTRMNVDAAQLRTFADQCMGQPEKIPEHEFASTGLPMTSEVFFNCAGSFSKSGCSQRYHEQPDSTIPPAVRKQFGQALDTILAMPSMHGLQIYLAAKTQTDDTADYLYIFDGDKLVTTEQLGWTTGDVIVTYDISKDYLVTQYYRTGDMNSKINKVTHMKLRSTGKFDDCPKENPACAKL